MSVSSSWKGMARGKGFLRAQSQFPHPQGRAKLGRTRSRDNPWSTASPGPAGDTRGMAPRPIQDSDGHGGDTLPADAPGAGGGRDYAGTELLRSRRLCLRGLRYADIFDLQRLGRDARTTRALLDAPVDSIAAAVALID